MKFWRGHHLVTVAEPVQHGGNLLAHRLTAEQYKRLCATSGSASGAVEFPTRGEYLIGLIHRGTPCDGVYPTAQISVDGERIGNIAVPDQQWQARAVRGRIDRGRHEVSVAFINDGSSAAEDRVPGPQERP